jgi:hypothetical protein
MGLAQLRHRVLFSVRGFVGQMGKPVPMEFIRATALFQILNRHAWSENQVDNAVSLFACLVLIIFLRSYFF